MRVGDDPETVSSTHLRAAASMVVARPHRVAQPRRFALAFADPALERAYRETRSYRWGPFAIGTAVLATAWLGLVGWIAAISPPTLAIATPLVFGIVMPLFALSLVATRLVRDRTRAVAFVNPVLAFCAGLVAVAIQVLSDDEHFTRFDAPSLALYVFIQLTFIRARFVNKVITTWALIAIWEAARLPVRPLSLERFVSDLFWVATAQMVGLRAAYTAEAQSRRLFVQQRTLDAERAKSERLEREAHERELKVLSEELRRQIVDRAGKLASALSRLQAEPPRTLKPSDVVDERYQVVRAIGAGGMGQVHEVERLADGRRMALKVLTHVADRAALARFAREAQLAAALDHPNVVAVHDIDVARSGMLYLVMELVPGASLAAERSRYGDARWALPIITQVARALAAMHARGIVHRDLKPSNILLAGSTAKVADFGIAGLTDASTATETRDLGEAAHLTRTHAVIGTPRYMAPELIHGVREAGRPADVFSFGVLAYELLSAQLPHSAPPLLEKMNRRAAPVATPLAQANPEITHELCALVDACVHETPETRPTADHVVAVLERLLAK